MQFEINAIKTTSLCSLSFRLSCILQYCAVFVYEWGGGQINALWSIKSEAQHDGSGMWKLCAVALK